MQLGPFFGKIALYFVMPLVASAIGGLVALLGPALGYFSKDRELDIEMVRISLSILAGENADTSLPGRKFALRTLSQYSKIDIPSEEFEDWAQRGTIPKSLSSAPLEGKCFELPSRAGIDFELGPRVICPEYSRSATEPNSNTSKKSR